MSDKFKPGDKVRVRGGSEVNFVIGPHPGIPRMFWAICPPDPQPILYIESDYELIPEPRKIEGWLVGDVDGTSGLYNELHHARKAFETFGTYIFHVTGESVEGPAR